MATVKLISMTPDAEVTMAYVARVSNPKTQETTTTDNSARLLSYCIRHGHWSVFEHAHMTVEVTTSLYVATQLLRHRSFTFQQFSQRYAKLDGEREEPFQPVALRMQDHKNRQNSTDDCPQEVHEDLQTRIASHLEATLQLYQEMLDLGIAKECARAILPQCSTTKLYMTGNCRNWVHYIQLRTHESTQREHRDVALAIRHVFCRAYPIVATALDWEID
jgi:thymidylate synthase (FAD)